MLALGGQKRVGPLPVPRGSPPRTLLELPDREDQSASLLLRWSSNRTGPVSEHLVCALSSTCTHALSFSTSRHNGACFTQERTEVERDTSLTRYCSLHLCCSGAHPQCLPGPAPLHGGCMTKGRIEGSRWPLHGGGLVWLSGVVPVL